MAVTHASVGAARLEAGRDPAEALHAYESARDVLEVVVAENPDGGNYADSLADTYFDISRVQQERDDAGGRLDALLRTREIQSRLAAMRPSVYRYSPSLLTTSLELVRVMEERGEHSAAQPYLNDARRVADTLLQTPPTSERHRKILAGALSTHAEAHVTNGDFPAAVRWQEALLKLTDGEADREARRPVLNSYKAAKPPVQDADPAGRASP